MKKTDITKMKDELVPFGQSCMLYDKLVQCKKEATFYAIENAHHSGREQKTISSVERAYLDVIKQIQKDTKK